MNRSALTKLVALTIVVVAAAALLKDDGPGAGTIAPGTPWLEGLAGRVNDVAAVEIVSGGERLELVRGDEAWELATWGGYPASFEPVKRAVVGLAELELVAARTARPERHADLQLGDPSSAGAAGTGVVLRDASGDVLADVVLGKAKGADGLFVRAADEDQTWQVRGTVDVPAAPARWVDTELLRLAEDEVTRVEVEAPGAEPLAIARGDDGWALTSLPEGRELVTAPPFHRLAGALAYLDLTGVASVEEAAAARDWTTTRFALQDGLVVTAHSAEDADGGDGWLRLSFEAVPVVPDADEGAAEDAGDADAAAGPPTPVLSPATAARAEELGARLSSWTFRIASWKTSALALSLDELLEPLPEVGPSLPEEGEGAADAPAAADELPPAGDGG